MGVLRFVVPGRERLAPDAVERAYMAGLDEIPWHARIGWTEDGLAVERTAGDSGNFFIPCPIDGHGEVMLSTTCLMERSKPYHLQVELARGALNRMRNQLAGWELYGMQVPAPVRAKINAASEHLSWAATHKSEEQTAADRALRSAAATLDAIDLLTASYVETALAARRAQAGKFNTLLGIDLGSARPSTAAGSLLAAAFNTAIVPMVWRDIEAHEGKRDWTIADAQIEWCRSAGLKVCGGPLLVVDKWSLPDWMYSWGEEDVDSFRSCVAEHIAAVVDRYRGKVQLWQCAARLNVESDFVPSEEERLRLAVLAIETIRRSDPRTPVVITIDQPWGAFMGRGEFDLSPLHFADALVRADLGLAGIGLEINYGYAPHGCEPRDMLEFSRQFDRFSTLGLPLLVTLAVPSSAAIDPAARIAARVIAYSAGGPPTPSAQRAWAKDFLPLLLCKQPVQGIIWNQLTDSRPHAFANAGLFDAGDQPKPIVEVITTLRKQHVL